MGKRARNKGPRRAYLKRFSASAVNAGQRINGNLHYQLNRAHIESLGVPDYGQSWNIKTWKDRLRKNYDEDGKLINETVIRDHDPIVKNRPQEFHPLPKTQPRLRDSICEALGIDPKLAANILKKNISSKFTEFHEIVLLSTGARELKLCFYANAAVFVDVYKDMKKRTISRKYPNTTRAMEVYKVHGARLLGWGPLHPYTE